MCYNLRQSCPFYMEVRYSQFGLQNTIYRVKSAYALMVVCHISREGDNATTIYTVFVRNFDIDLSYPFV